MSLRGEDKFYFLDGLSEKLVEANRLKNTIHLSLNSFWLIHQNWSRFIYRSLEEKKLISPVNIRYCTIKILKLYHLQHVIADIHAWLHS